VPTGTADPQRRCGSKSTDEPGRSYPACPVRKRVPCPWE